jgi:hypothetical protein
MNGRSFFLAILIAGVAIGFFGNLPLLNLINCALCIWVWIGGALAVYLYNWFQHGEAVTSIAQGAGLGALAGLIGAVVGALVFAITSPLSIALFNNLAAAMRVEGDLPFRNNSFWETMATVFIFLIVDAILYPIFGAIGGMIAASITRKPRALSA